MRGACQAIDLPSAERYSSSFVCRFSARRPKNDRHRVIYSQAKRNQTLSTATTTPTPETANSGVRQHYAPLPFTRVTIEDSFWAPKRVVNRERTIPHIYRQ